MKWINVKEIIPPMDERVLVTDGKNLGYTSWTEYIEDVYEKDDWLSEAIGGIPDSTSNKMKNSDIKYWCKIILPKGINGN